MIYEIPKTNLLAHEDIAESMQKRKVGLFTFIIRVNKGHIVDYVEMEYVSGKRLDLPPRP